MAGIHRGWCGRRLLPTLLKGLVGHLLRVGRALLSRLLLVA